MTPNNIAIISSKGHLKLASCCASRSSTAVARWNCVHLYSVSQFEPSSLTKTTFAVTGNRTQGSSADQYTCRSRLDHEGNTTRLLSYHIICLQLVLCQQLLSSFLSFVTIQFDAFEVVISVTRRQNKKQPKIPQQWPKMQPKHFF